MDRTFFHQSSENWENFPIFMKDFYSSHVCCIAFFRPLSKCMQISVVLKIMKRTRLLFMICEYWNARFIANLTLNDIAQVLLFWCHQIANVLHLLCLDGVVRCSHFHNVFVLWFFFHCHQCVHGRFVGRTSMFDTRAAQSAVR